MVTAMTDTSVFTELQLQFLNKQQKQKKGTSATVHITMSQDIHTATEKSLQCDMVFKRLVKKVINKKKWSVKNL